MTTPKDYAVEMGRNFPKDSILENLEKLLSVTEKCRIDMHEPDEQGVSAAVVGNRLDNAGCKGEFVVMICRENGSDEDVAIPVNLADLIALARVGAQEVKSFLAD